MSWTSLRERLDELPLVLAGPILRRTEAGAVTVRVTLRQSRTVTLQIYDDAGSMLFSHAQPTVPVGDNLHVVAVTAQAQGEPLVAGKTYEYDLHFGGDKRLASSGVLTSSG